MDAFGCTLSSLTNKLIADGNKKFEHGLKQLDDSIGENRKKIANLIITCDKFENKFKLNDKAIDENLEKIENLNATSNIRLFVVETNVNKLLTALSTLEGTIANLTSRVNYLDIVFAEDSTVPSAQPTTRAT